MTNNNISFSALFSPAQIICDLPDNSLKHTIHQLIEHIADSEQTIDIEAAYRLLLFNEGCGFMLIQPDLAVIHIRIEGLQQLRIALATSQQGFICSAGQHGFQCVAEDIGRINTAILMMVPADDPTSYLRAIAALKVICRQEGFCEQLGKLNTPDNIWEAFTKHDAQLPDYVEAHHIMRTDYSYLHVSDNLSQAIDLFCTKMKDEFPVIDDDGELVGIVSEEELIRLCLPEYITWMDDLSPIINFEPFAEILRREHNMPVMEIMEFSDRYATVDESTPAIQVAKIMMRREVRQVFVVRHKKLMGLISIQDLIQKVLRA